MLQLPPSLDKVFFKLMFWLTIILFTIPGVSRAYSMEMPQQLSSSPMDATPMTAAKTQGLTAAMVQTAAKDHHLLIWTMYPASVRGRVFGGTGGDPLTGGGGGGW